MKRRDMECAFDPRPEVVWLDLDDTLIDFHGNSRKALAMTWEEYGFEQLFPDVEAWIDVYERYNKALWEQYNRAEITKDFLRAERFRRPLVEGGMDEDEALNLCGTLDSYYLDRLAEQKGLVDGAVELLSHLRARGYKIGVLSNGFKQVQHRKIESAGLSSLIDVVVLSDDIGVNKPDVRLYRHAMERTGYLEPSLHVMIGDNPDTDIAGAVAAGWGAVFFDPKASCRIGGVAGGFVVNALGACREIL